MRRGTLRVFTFAVLLCNFPFGCATLQAADWPQFGRDGTRNAVSSERHPPTDWDIGKPVNKDPRQRIPGSSRNIKWSAALGTNAFGDPVVANGLVWVGTNNGYNAQDKRDASVLACFRESDGKLLYRYVSPRLPQNRVLDWEYRSMSCSPLIDGDRLWFVTNRAEVVCLDIGPLRRGEGDPKPIWNVDLIEKFGVFPRTASMGLAHSCSIAGYRDLLYVITGNGIDEAWKKVVKPEAPSLICFHRDTGEAVWQDKSPGGNILDGQWSSPAIIEVDGIAQCVAAQGDGWIRSFDALSGKPIWQFDMNRKEGRWSLERSTRYGVLASPVFADNRIYIASGMQPELGERPGRLVCLDPTRHGDISSELAVDREGKAIPHRRIQAVDPALGEKSVPNPNSGLVWEFTHLADGKAFTDVMHGSLSNVVVHQGLVIAADSTGLVHCLDAKIGQRHWVFDGLASIYGSPLIVDDKVYVVDSDGDVMIFRISPDPDVALRRKSGELRPLREISVNNYFYCSPVFANGTLYLTAHNELYAIAADKAGRDADLTAGYWPQWRGPNRDNASTDKGLLSEWPEGGPPRAWTAVGIGEGIASVSLINGRIFTVGYQDESEFVVALEEQSGELNWAKRVGPAVAENKMMRWLTQRTPTVDEVQLYAITAGGDLVCLDIADGRELWRKNYVQDFGAQRPAFGFGEYPLVDGDRLICTPGGPAAAMVALDKKTGAVVWKSSLPAAQAAGNPGAPVNHEDYSGVAVTEVGGLRQYVTFLDHRLTGVAADDGRILWRYEPLGGSLSNSHTPVVRGDHVFGSSESGGSVLLKLIHEGKNVASEQIYQNRQLRFDRFLDTEALVGDHIFASPGQGAVQRIAWTSGELVWSERVPDSRGRLAFTYADDRLYLRGSEGQMTLAQPTAKGLVPKGAFSIPEHENALGATLPVIAGRHVYLRDENRLHCYDVRAEALLAPAAPPRTIPLAVPAADRRAAAPPNAQKDRSPPKGVFVPTPRDVVRQMLDLAQIRKTDVVCDLGSGDGRIVIAAAKKYGCKAIGYELDPALVKLSREAAAAVEVEKLVTIEMADVFTADLRKVDVVTLYLLPQQVEKLVPQLKTLKPGSRIISHQFEIPGIKADREVQVDSDESGAKHVIYLWTLPFKDGTQ